MSSLENASWRSQSDSGGRNLQVSLEALAYWAQALGLLRSRGAVFLERHGPDPDLGP